MIPSRKLVNQVFLTFIFCVTVLKPDLVAGKVFDRVVAKVNSEIITLSSVEERVEILKQKYRNDLQNIDEKRLQLEALEMIVGEKLQVQQGKKMGLEVDDSAVDAALKDIENRNGLQEGQLVSMLESEGRSVEDYKNHIREQILVSKITQFELGSRINISERSIAKYYHDHQKEFWDSGKARVRHILILFEEGATAKSKKGKYKEIQKVLAEVRGGKDFAEAAKEYSEDVSASSGGDVGFVEKGKMVPEFEKAVYSLRKGEISNIVETKYGYHIIKVEELKKGRTLPLKEVKKRIQSILSGKKQKSAYDDWMKELKESAFIEMSLFEKPKMSLRLDLSDSKRDREDDPIANNDLRDKRQELSTERSKKIEMQNKWEEMYKSVETSKKRNPTQMDSPLQTMEQKLKQIKKLRDQKKISEAEYQRRKKKLLDGL